MTTTADVHLSHPNLDRDQTTGHIVLVAGHITIVRIMGKLGFLTLQDETGELRLFAKARWTYGFDEFCALPLHTHVAVMGEVATVKTGELCVQVHDWVVA